MIPEQPIIYGRYTIQPGEGDPRTDKELRNRIAMAHEYIAHNVIKNRYPRMSYGAEYADYVQMAMLGIMRAAELFDHTINDNFGAYARQWAHGGISQHLRPYGHSTYKHLQGRWNHRTFSSLVNRFDDGDESELDPAAPEADHAYDALDIPVMLSAVKGALTKKEWAILHGRYIKGRTLDDVGTDYGVSRERIRQISVEAFAKARRAIATRLRAA